MTSIERFYGAMNFRPVDRLPVIEWASWWDKTIERWRGEGLPADARTKAEIDRFLGLDALEQVWINHVRKDTPRKCTVSDEADYDSLRQYLFSVEDAFDRERVRTLAERRRQGEPITFLTLTGFFWLPRTLFGIERHLYGFYDEPDLMRRMNADLLEFNLRVLDEFCSICVPDFMTFGEDMSYNHGPMISEKLFFEFIAPFYREIIPEVKRRGILPVIDSDGDVTVLMDWFAQVGVDGFLPLERQAGVDIAGLRRKHPRSRFIGAFDKMAMTRGEESMRAEFERLLPVMKQGGFVPSVDHQTPPGVSLEEYRLYLSLLKEYCAKAAD